MNTAILPFIQQKDSVSARNFQAPQFVHTVLSLPTSTVLKKYVAGNEPSKHGVYACMYLLSSCVLPLLLSCAVLWISSSQLPL